MKQLTLIFRNDMEYFMNWLLPKIAYQFIPDLKQKGAEFLLLLQYDSCNSSNYSSSSKVIASLAVCNNSYSSLEPTIMFSNSRKPVPAGIK